VYPGERMSTPSFTEKSNLQSRNQIVIRID
jgi:hypothetical protein